jgi:hypothetical protein
MHTLPGKFLKRSLLSEFAAVLALITLHSARAAQLHTSILIKDVDDSFVCSASNLAPDTLEITIAIISGGIPPEDIFRTTLTCAPGRTCSIGTSPGDFRTAARCSIFFSGPARNVRAVLRTFGTRERAEAR